MERNVFIIGSKGIPAKYGGFETFVENLTLYRKKDNIKYHVACLAEDNKEFEHNNARCFNIKVPNIGPAKAVYYDVKALNDTLAYIKKNKIENAIIYILACRIGPFMHGIKKKCKKSGVQVYLNPDGHEWLRAKWNTVIKKYWKISERLMIKEADFIICDSVNIEKYIKKTYEKYNPKTTFIAYGADIDKSTMPDDDKKLNKWFDKHGIKPKEYYLVVGRFVPENNYEVMIREFMKSDTKKKLVIITNVDNEKLYNDLKSKTGFDKDERIKFVGTVYEKEFIKKIRELAYGYLHGHSVGGTNPSLIEALATTDLNLLFDVGFNREVGEEGALYWSRKQGHLAKILNKADTLSAEKIAEYSDKAKKRVHTEYSWDIIVKRYEDVLG